LIREMGGAPYYIPAIEIKGLTNFAPVENLIMELCNGQVDYVIFMSTNGVKYLFSAADSLKQRAELTEGLAKTFIIAIGPRTAQVLEQDNKMRVGLVPSKYSSEGLLESLQSRELKGKNIRIPRTSNATPILTDNLRARGAQVEEVYVYESGLPEDEEIKQKFFEDLKSRKIDAIVFGSGLSAKNIFKMLTEKASAEEIRSLLNTRTTTVAIGPTTADALREMGIKIDVMPADYLFENALEALGKYWSNN